jgi:membrane protein
VPFRGSLAAGLVATVLFELARKAFAIYIKKFATYQLIYGALAVIPIFLVWLYISWVIILFGVVVNYVLAGMNSENKH